MRRTTIAVFLASALSACGTFQVGGNFDLAAFQSQVRRGETTQAEVQRMLGAPDGTGVSVETGGERYTQWTYYYGSGSLTGPSNARVKMLQIKFDPSGVVRAYNWTANTR
jgi:outer membrane protein assembly factor BamE (lipoprotein component of BamABCDE complex)